jgi:hypothetical protein
MSKEEEKRLMEIGGDLIVKISFVFIHPVNYFPLILFKKVQNEYQ